MNNPRQTQASAEPESATRPRPRSRSAAILSYSFAESIFRHSPASFIQAWTRSGSIAGGIRRSQPASVSTYPFVTRTGCCDWSAARIASERA